MAHIHILYIYTKNNPYEVVCARATHTHTSPHEIVCETQRQRAFRSLQGKECPNCNIPYIKSIGFAHLPHPHQLVLVLRECV